MPQYRRCRVTSSCARSPAAPRAGRESAPACTGGRRWPWLFLRRPSSSLPRVECWRGGSALRLGPDQVVELPFQRTDLGPAVDRTALLRFQHPPFELCMRFARTQLTDGLLSMVTQPCRCPVPLPPDAKSPHLGSRAAHRGRSNCLAVAHSQLGSSRTLAAGICPPGWLGRAVSTMSLHLTSSPA